ncbi:hypothetical protein [uncultured Hymenobacter sp.]|uniref:hypothetical protein n=1 Tax=uncultured Hymenobacter sp. TaxID=170016 RepID=UPI0035CB27CE
MSRKLPALLTVLVLLLALTTYVYYRRTLAAVPLDAYALVPDDAVLVLSTSDHPALVRHLQEAQLWDNLTAIGYFQQAAGHLALADSLAGGGSARSGGLLRLLGRKLVVTSLHVTGPARYDLLFQVPLTTVREYRQVRSLLDALGRDRRYRLARRELDGHELSLLTEISSETSLTVVNYRNRLLVSSNAGLVEAALRRAARPPGPANPTVAADFQELDLLRGRGIDGTLLINYRRLPTLLDVLLQPGRPPAADYLASLARNGLLQVRLGGNRVLAQGFSNPETATDALHQRLRGVPTGPLALADIISTRTALLLHLAAPPGRLRPPAAPAASGVSALASGVPLGVGLSAGLSAGPGALAGAAPGAAAFVARHEAVLDSLRATLGPEVAVAYLAAPAPGRPAGQLALVRCPAPARTARWLGRERRAAGLSPGFTRIGPYALYAAGFEARAVLGKLAEAGRGAEAEAGQSFGADSRAAALVGSYLVLGPAPVLQAYLQDVAGGQVWTRSPGQVAFLNELLPQARLSVIVDTRQAWNALLGLLREDRRAGLLRHETLFKRLPQMALQLAPAAETAPGAHYYTQLLLRHPQQGPAATLANAATASPGLAFKRGLRGAPLLLPLAGGAPRPAVLLTDSAGVAHLVSPDDVVLWSDTLGAVPVAPAQALALRPNEPPHLLLATPRQLHLLGAADGREAPHFPLNLPDSLQATGVGIAVAGPGGAAGTAAGTTAGAAAPRLLVAAGRRALLLLDADGRLFPGWQPKRLDAPLAGAPLLLSVGGRDVVLALLENGYVYAYDQQGSPWPGFPLSVGARLAGGAWVRPGATLSRTRISVVNQHGELVSFSLSGEGLTRRRVATWSRTARFRLVPSQSAPGGVGNGAVSPSVVVVREDGGQLAVFRPEGGPAMLTQGFLTSDEKRVQFFDFGRGRQVLALTEPGPGQVFLYDGQGRRLSREALPSTGSGVGLSPPATPGGRYQLLRVVGRELRRAEL